MSQNRIPWYKNGECPLDRLVVIKEGYNPTDGKWQHRLPRATLRRWRRLVNRAYARTGRTLVIADGWATDRPYFAQVIARRIFGNLAATPGTSSHGMVFENQQTAAIDAGNWAWVYEHHGYDAWLSDLRAEGFDRLPAGYPLDGERHHIIDYNPWDDEPEFGGAPASSDAVDFAPQLIAPRSTKMTIYARRDDGLVVAIPEGGPTYNYASAAEYNRNRETIAVINGQRKADGQPLITLPPVLGSIVTMTSERLNDLIRSQGAVLSPAPVVKIDIPKVPVPEIDVDEIATKVNDEADRRARERLN